MTKVFKFVLNQLNCYAVLKLEKLKVRRHWNVNLNAAKARDFEQFVVPFLMFVSAVFTIKNVELFDFFIFLFFVSVITKSSL